MNLHEWPLTLFTLLAQMAVGAFIVLGLIQVIGRTKFNTSAIDRIADPALYAIGPIMICAFLASMFHLGNPLHAPNVLRGWSHSALSQEIIMGIGFAGLGFAFAACQYFGWLTPKWRSALAVLTAVWGLFFVYVMASLYMLPTIPAWNHWTTPAQFYITAFTTGALAMGVALSSYPFLKDSKLVNKLMPRNAVHSEEEERDVARIIPQALKWIGIIVVTLLPLELLVILFYYMRPEGSNPPQFEFNLTAFVIRLALLIIGALIMAFYLVFQAQSDQKKTLIMVTTAYILITISGLLGRFIFYGGIDRVGI